MAEVQQEVIELPREEMALPKKEEDSTYGLPNKNQKEIAIRNSVTPFFDEPELLLQKLEESKSTSLEGIYSQDSDAYINTMRSLDADILAASASLSPEESMAAADLIRQEEMKNLSESPEYLSYKNSILSTKGSESLSPKEIENLAADMLLLNGLGKMVDEKSAFSVGYDLLGMMFITDMAWNNSGVMEEISEELREQGVVTGDYLDSFSDMVSLANYRRELPEEDRLRFDKRLSEIYDEIDDNELQKAEFFVNLMGKNEYFEIEDTLDKAGLAATLAQLGPALVMKAVKGAQLAKRLGDMKDYQGAMKAADLSAESPEHARVLGTSQIDSANAGHPAKDLFAGAPKGVSTKYRHHARNIDEALLRLDNVTEIDVALHTPEEQIRIAASLRKNLPKDLEIDDVKVTFQEGQPVVSYKVVDEAGDTIEEVSKPYTLDDVGSYVDPEVGLGSNVLRGVVSPKYVQGADAKSLVDRAVTGTLAKAKIGADYTKAAEEAFKPIRHDKKAIQSVDKMLQMLDGKDITPSYQVLVREGVGGHKLTDKEFLAFTGIRKVLDDMWHRNNTVLRQEMDLKGTRSITVEGDRVFAKPYETPESAEAAFHNDPDSITIFKDGVEYSDVSKASLEKAYKEGYILVRSHSDSFDDWFVSGAGGDKKFFRFALVKRDDVGGLPPTVLQRTPNYLPKFNKDANFFVKEMRVVNVSGRRVPKPITLGYAPTRMAAEKALIGLKKFDLENDVERVLEITQDSMEHTLASGDIIRASGGLIRGKRSKEGIEFFGDFGGGRADAFESIQRAIGMTSDRIPLSRWRMAAREEWMNSAKLKVKDLSPDWKAAREEVANLPIGKARTKLLSAHDQISGMSMIPTKGEQSFKGHILSAAEKLDRIDTPVSQRVASYLYRVRDKNPVELMKSATFNLTLGAFSMVQIPVQAAGALVAFSVNPISAAKAFDKWLIASALDLGTDMKIVRDTSNILAKRMGMSKSQAKTLENDYAFWRASGLKESVVRGNADASSIMNGLPIDAGLARRGFTKLLEAGQTPYRMGELTNMRISFFTALEREKDLMGKAFKYDNATLQKVLARTENTRLNMNAANKAAFQKGFLSLPTQFKQIYTKYIEALAGREFTGAEKLRILSVQAAAFGVAGVPIINHFSNELMKVTGISENADSESLSMIQRGSIGWMLNDYYGVDAAFSGRLTVSADILEELRRIAVDGRTPMLETFAGASAAPFKNGVKFFENLLLAGNLLYDAEKMNVADLQAASEIALEGLARMSSSGRNVLAARDMHYGWVRNSDGIPLYQVDAEKADILFRVVGFGSQEKMDIYEQGRINLDIKEERKGRADQYVSAWFTLAHALKEENADKVRHAQIALSMINTQIDNYGVEEAARIRRMVLDRINDPSDKKGKVVNEAIEIFYTDAINAYNSSVPSIRGEIEELDKIGRRILQENQ